MAATLPPRLIPPLAKNFSREQASAWLAGFVDGEGCVYFRRVARGGKHFAARVITITNTDPALIDVMVHCLQVLGIEFGRSDRAGKKAQHKHAYTIEIRKGAAMWRFRDLVPIQAPEKRRRLDLALESYRGLHCHGCACLHDRYTKGCGVCKSRRYARDHRKPKVAA